MNSTANDVNKTKPNEKKQMCEYEANLLSYLIKAKGAHLQNVKKSSFVSTNENSRRFIYAHIYAIRVYAMDNCLFAQFLDGYTIQLQNERYMFSLSLFRLESNETITSIAWSHYGQDKYLKTASIRITKRHEKNWMCTMKTRTTLNQSVFFALFAVCCLFFREAANVCKAKTTKHKCIHIQTLTPHTE